MENMNDIKFFEVERPKIPQVLIDATNETTRVSARERETFLSSDHLDDRDSSNNEHSSSRSRSKSSKRAGRRSGRNNKDNNKNKHHRLSSIAEDEEEQKEKELPHRAHGERRMGFLIIGDQHRLGKGGLNSYLYPDAPPIDFSFSLLSTVEEITSTGESPNTKRNYKFPEKTEDERYKTSSVRLSYNLLESIDGLVSVMYKTLDGGPLGLCWVDLSFNHINALDEDTLSQIPNIKIMYLHGNSLADMTEIPKLQVLPLLQTLTLHGNPVEEEDGYRACILYYLPKLKHLDFIGVTKSDRANAGKFGKYYEPHWQRRHMELETQAKQIQAAQEISYTDKLMQEEEDEDDLDFKAYAPN